jgi:hypothetical protein
MQKRNSWSRIKTAYVIGAIMPAALGGSAFGQINLMDQTRTLTANATGTASLTIGTGLAAGTQSLNSDSTAAAGLYSNALNGTKTDSYNDGTGDSTAFNVSSSAQQTSVISTSLFSASSMVGASAVLYPIEGYPGFSADGYAQSTFNTDFTVSTPTPFSLTGDITGTAEYHVGRLEIIAANLTFSENSTPLYSVDFAPTGYTEAGESFDEPASFSTLLEPGQVYTLNAESSVDSGRAGTGLTSVAPASAGFTFTAAVPEPVSLFLVPIAAILISRRGSVPEVREQKKRKC